MCVTGILQVITDPLIRWEWCQVASLWYIHCHGSQGGSWVGNREYPRWQSGVNTEKHFYYRCTSAGHQYEHRYNHCLPGSPTVGLQFQPTNTDKGSPSLTFLNMVHARQWAQVSRKTSLWFHTWPGVVGNDLDVGSEQKVWGGVSALPLTAWVSLGYFTTLNQQSKNEDIKCW